MDDFQQAAGQQTVNKDDTLRAYRDLAAGDPVLARLAAEFGNPVPTFTWRDGGRTASSRFAALLLHIVGQQISTHAAFRIYDRISEAVGGVPTPEGILRLGANGLRAAGMSAAKERYALELAQAEASGTLDLDGLDDLTDDEAVAALTAIRGIGAWTAEMFLLVNLHRPDVLPAGDLGIRRAVQRQWGLDAIPSPGAVRARAQAWCPWRSYAAMLLWRSLGLAESQPADAPLLAGQ